MKKSNWTTDAPGAKKLTKAERKAASHYLLPLASKAFMQFANQRQDDTWVIFGDAGHEVLLVGHKLQPGETADGPGGCVSVAMAEALRKLVAQHNKAKADFAAATKI